MSHDIRSRIVRSDALLEPENSTGGKDQAEIEQFEDDLTPGNLHFTVFGTDWGRHPDSLQQIFLNLKDSVTIDWVGSVGMRPPRLTKADLVRIFTRVAHTQQSELASASPAVDSLVKPLVLPWHHIKLVRWLNRHFFFPSLRNQLSLPADNVVVTMYPTAELFARELPASLRVAYAADDYSEMPGVNSEFIRSMEHEWIDGSDIVFCSANNLVDRYQAWGHDDVHLLAHGVDIEAFLNAEPGGLPGLEHLDGPIIGFVGAISPWVDLELIGDVADQFPEATVVLVGPIDTDLGRLAERKNVLVAGPVPFEKVPGIMKRFDVGIIPFAQTPLMDSVNPLKLLEYLAAGVPVVSTPMGDMEEVEGAVGVAADSESFIRRVEQALLSARNPAHVDQRIAIAQERSWRSVAMEFRSAVERRSGQVA